MIRYLHIDKAPKHIKWWLTRVLCFLSGPRIGHDYQPVKTGALPRCDGCGKEFPLNY